MYIEIQILYYRIMYIKLYQYNINYKIYNNFIKYLYIYIFYNLYKNKIICVQKRSLISILLF